MAKTLGVGIVGAGFIGKFHIRSWLGVRHADIAAVCDPDGERAAEAAALARELGVGEPKTYARAADMVKDPRVDAVWICCPNHVRLQVMEEILSAGKGKLAGVTCEKPLGRNVAEAKRMVAMVRELGVPHGYLESQVFMPMILRGKELLWRRGARLTGRPYLARSAEEHSGPHEPWFWSGKQQGGGVLNDMMCHSIEAARFLLTDPDKPRSSLTPKTVGCDIASLKWTRREYAERLKKQMGVDFLKTPVEDFAHVTIAYETDEKDVVVVEGTTSWSFVGPGLRLSMEVMGPEYSMQGSSINNRLSLFLSREVSGKEGEDIVEKQTAEQGLMPVVTDEASEYGYTEENRHMVDSFLARKMPCETFDDGLEVTKLLMACYMSAERGERLAWEPAGLDDFIPAVAKETYNPADMLKGK